MGYDFGQGLKGAGGGALAGGSLGGPVGALVGGGLGLLGGFGNGPSEDEQKNRQMLMDYYKQVQGREAPQMGPAAQGGMSSFRSNQSDLVSRLEAMSKGQGPSLAAEQFKANTDRLGAQQSSIANSGRGGPLAAQAAANNTALLGAQASQGAAQGRIQEQFNAMNQLGLTLHGARGADEDMNRFNAGQQNETGQANLAARLKAMGLNDEAIQRTLGQLGGSASNQQGRPGYGDQLLAGGAGLFSLGASQGAQQNASGQQFNSSRAQDALAARQQARAYDNRGKF